MNPIVKSGRSALSGRLDQRSNVEVIFRSALDARRRGFRLPRWANSLGPSYTAASRRHAPPGAAAPRM
jgi:hypothetical protein